MTISARSISPFCRFPAPARLAMDPCRRCSPLAAAGRARHRRRPDRPRRAAAMTASGTCLRHHPAGNCNSGYSVSFTGLGRPGFVGRRRPGLRLGQPRRRRRGQDLGRRLQCERQRPARRHQRRRPLERHHHPATVAAALAGDAGLIGTKSSGIYVQKNRPARSPDGPFSIFTKAMLPKAATISAAPAPSRPGGLRNARPARPWRIRRRRP